jgi:hypothetical protein
MCRTDATASRLLATRKRTYSRHLAPLPNSDEANRDPSSDFAVIFSAEAKTSGESFGSIRIETNLKNSFYFEEYVKVPELITRVPAVCASRLNVVPGPIGRVVKAALCKALYLYACAMQCQTIYAFVDASRARLYTSIGFKPVLDNNPLLELPQHGGLKHFLFKAEVLDFERNLKKVEHPLHDFVCNTYHPDIRIFESVASLAQVRRKSDNLARQQTERLDDNLLPTPSV